MTRALRLAVVASLFVLPVSASAGGDSRSCAAIIAGSDGGGLVAFLIRFSGADWWAAQFARARPCG